MFFPMLILRVLENVLQPSFLQKMTVLNLLDKISQDPQIIIDIFVNYDCDVDASNIFERYLAFVIFRCSYTLLVVSFQEQNGLIIQKAYMIIKPDYQTKNNE